MKCSRYNCRVQVSRERASAAGGRLATAGRGAARADGDSTSGEDGVIDAVVLASRTMVAVAAQSLSAAAEDITIAQYRALVMLMSRGPQRMTDLAGALDVAPSTAGRMCDRLVRKGLIRRHRARADRRAVLVSVTAAGRQVVDQATARRRVLIADILRRMPRDRQQSVAEALQAFAGAAGEVPDSQWPQRPVDEVPAVSAEMTREPIDVTTKGQ